MKKYIILIGGVLCLILFTYGIVVSTKYKNIKQQYEISQANVKAYDAQLTNQKQAFQFSIEQLEYLNDSIIHELNNTRKELGIKDKQIQQMSKIKEYVYIKDTLKVMDTIFKEPNFSLDTCLGDRWYSNCLHLEYPNQISSELNVNTDLNCFIYTKRETINPPCKTWIGRLFQKKHTVINVDVIENNPHSNVKEIKFIKILDK